MQAAMAGWAHCKFGEVQLQHFGLQPCQLSTRTAVASKAKLDGGGTGPYSPGQASFSGK